MNHTAYLKSPSKSMQTPVFTARRSYASAVLGVVILSVRPSVRLWKWLSGKRPLPGCSSWRPTNSVKAVQTL